MISPSTRTLYHTLASKSIGFFGTFVECSAAVARPVRCQHAITVGDEHLVVSGVLNLGMPCESRSDPSSLKSDPPGRCRPLTGAANRGIMHLSTCVDRCRL